jgi:hypothetical protein
MRALGLLETLLDLPKFELQKLALLKSDKNFNSAVALHRDGIDIPLKFIHYDGNDGVGALPVCPKCLSEEAYIKQVWHLKWVNHCTKHKCALVHHCPECSLPVNYIENESITHCSCGFELSCSASDATDSHNLEALDNLLGGESENDNPLFKCTSVSQRFAALLWYQQRYDKHEVYDINEVVRFFGQWPNNFIAELDDISQHAEMRLIDLFNKTKFRYIYSELILSIPRSFQNEGKPHFIWIALMEYLVHLVEQNPKSKKPNVADMLVSVSEASVILSTSHEQVYRLYQDGILKSAIRHKMKQRIDPHAGVFFLRQVIEYKTSFGVNNSRMYLSAW